MAVDKIGKDTIGCAYYVARDGVLRCMEDMHDVQESILDTCMCSTCHRYRPQLTDAVKLDIQPTIILLSSRIDHMFDLDVTRSDRIDSDGKHSRKRVDVISTLQILIDLFFPTNASYDLLQSSDTIKEFRSLPVYLL